MGCSPLRRTVDALDVSQRLPSIPSVQLQAHLAKCEIQAVSTQELRFLSKLFGDLASRSTGHTVDRHTFLRFFPLPVSPRQGIWGERLFDNFDKKQQGFIDYEAFITGLSVCTKGSEEDRLRFLFSLFDLRGDGFIDKSELKTMVRLMQIHNTFKHTHRASPASETSDDREVTRPRTPYELRRGERRSSAALIKRDDEASPDRVGHLADKIMTDLATTSIDFEQFKMFITQNPRIMEVFSGTFREDVWSSRLGDILPSRSVPRPSRQRRCFSCFGSDHDLKVATTATQSFHPEKAGWLYRKTLESSVTEKLYVVQRSTMLLVFNNPSTLLPNSVIFLEGCYIDPLAEFSQTQRHGFSISHQFGSFKQVSFWTQSKDERDDWVRRLCLLAKTSKVEDFFDFKERLGSGRFSDVFKAVELRTGLEWAIKVVEKTRLNELEREMLRSEVAIMRLLNHHNVVEMKEVYEDRTKLYLVMELVEGGELFDRIRQSRVFTEYTAFHCCRQLLQIVQYLHEVGIIHRDIKPENILLSDDSEVPILKLADFGLSKLVGPDETLQVPCGTLGYVAPEVLMQRPYGKAIDLWSVGIVTYLMLRGRLPFDSKDKQAIVEKTIEARLDLEGPYWAKMTKYGLDFLRQILAKDPAHRLTVEQALAHPWIRMGEVVIPRKINRAAIEENVKKTVTTAKMQHELFSEHPQAVTLDSADQRLFYTTPDVFEDMQVERKQAELSLTIRLQD